MKKQRKSSRKAMATRSGKKRKASPTFLVGANLNRIPFNRAARQIHFALERKAFSQPVRDDQRQQRRNRLTKARRKARVVRNETQKAMRG